jgi:hypothetical protein
MYANLYFSPEKTWEKCEEGLYATQGLPYNYISNSDDKSICYEGPGTSQFRDQLKATFY